MNLFDIIGPVMVGPSSSHTAGVVRIGNVARNILGCTPTKARIKFHGSFAKTYAGHGSDKAIIGGLLGCKPDDESIRNSLQAAADIGLVYSFEVVEIPDAHPNTLIVEAEASDGKYLSLLGESIGGGNILVRRINDIEVEYNGQYDTLVINHKDAPGAISLVANLLAVARINIASMKVYRASKGGDAIMLIEIDGKLDKALSKTVESLPHITKATVLEGL